MFIFILTPNIVNLNGCAFNFKRECDSCRKKYSKHFRLAKYDNVSKLFIRTYIDFQRMIVLRRFCEGTLQMDAFSPRQVIVNMCFLLPSLSHSEPWKSYFSTLITELVENVFRCLAVLLMHSICLWLFEKAILIRSDLQLKWTLICLAKAGAAYLCKGLNALEIYGLKICFPVFFSKWCISGDKRFQLYLQFFFPRKGQKIQINEINHDSNWGC